jgi:hypothetical protein
VTDVVSAALCDEDAMAKQSSRTQADDVSTSVPPGAKANARPKAQRELRTTEVPGAGPDEVMSDMPASRPEAISRHLSDAQQSPGDDAAAGDALSARADQRARTSEPTHEEIRWRAYQMYLERGGGDGEDFNDWVRAERELRKQ